MGKGKTVARRGQKKVKRCCINLKRLCKKIFTCGGRLPRWCKKSGKPARKLMCWSPCCRWCNLCEGCKKCRRLAKRCCCRSRRGVRRVAHIEYYKVKKRRRTPINEQASEDHSQVYYCTVNKVSKHDNAKESKSNAKDSADEQKDQAASKPVEIKDEVKEEANV